MAFLNQLLARLCFMRIVLMLLAALMCPPVHADDAEREYAVKAVFLYNFCQFVDWPPKAFISKTAPIVIGVIGNDPFGTSLEETVQNETVGGRPIRIAHYRNAGEAKDCHVLFVCASEIRRQPAIISELRGRNIVTVGETEDFIDQGGMISLTASQKRVRLRINQTAVRETELSMSSKLLRVAEVRR